MSSSLLTARQNQNRGTMRFWFWTWLPVLLGIIMIMCESTETFGGNHTSRWLRPIYQWLFGPIADAPWEHIHILIRKTGHFIGYGLIGLAWLRAWWFTLPRSRFLTDFALAMLGTATIASCDEWHQSFLPNRTSSVWDVLIDCTGACTLQLIVYTYMRIRKPKQLSRAA
jgi:VanZ family protein